MPAVPVDAIVTHEGQDFIFIRTEAQRENKPTDADHTEEKDASQTQEAFVFKKIPVHRGITDIGYVEITSVTELPKNALVVVKGAFFLLAKMNNKGEGYAH